MSRLTADLKEDLARQRKFVTASVPSYARVLELLSSRLDSNFRDRLDAAWAGRAFGAWYERPLLLLAALRAAALRTGEEHPLYGALRDDEPDPSAVTSEKLAAAVAPEQQLFWDLVSQRAVQTNEVSRAVAWLWPASIVRRLRPGAAVDLHDIGASAGLNLLADRLPWLWHDTADASLVSGVPEVGRRKGYDRSPLDPADTMSRLWLRACIWPGQTKRLDQLDAALAAFDELRAADQAPRLMTAGAADIPELLETPSDVAIAYQTVVRGYLSDVESEAYAAGMSDWLRRAPGGALWVELEPTRTEDEPDRAAVITAHVADAAGRIVDLDIARCHPHPRRLYVDSAAVARLEGLMG